MKYFIRTSFFLAFAIVLLAGCTNPFAKTIEPMAQDVIEDIEDEEGIGKLITCDMLNDADSQNDCYFQQNEIAINELYGEIRKTFSLSRCAELPESMIGGCQDYIEKTGIQGPITMEEYDALQAAMRPVVNESEDEEAETYDVNNCVALTVTGMRGYCEKKINERMQNQLIDEIFQSGDAARCDELTDEESRAGCKLELGGGVTGEE